MRASPRRIKPIALYGSNGTSRGCILLGEPPHCMSTPNWMLPTCNARAEYALGEHDFKALYERGLQDHKHSAHGKQRANGRKDGHFLFLRSQRKRVSLQHGAHPSSAPCLKSEGGQAAGRTRLPARSKSGLRDDAGRNRHRRTDSASSAYSMKILIPKEVLSR